MKTTVLLRYCWTDLFSESVRLVPALQLVLLASCATVYLFSKGLPEHQKYLRLQELANNPGARSLHIVGNSGSLGTGRMQRSDYESLEKKLGSVVGSGIIEAMIPDHGKLEITFRSSKRTNNTRFKGKILNDQDTSLIGQKLVDGQIMTTEMLRGGLDDVAGKDKLPIILGRRFRSDIPDGDLSDLIGQFDGLDWWIPEIAPFCELVNEQVDQMHFYVFKSHVDHFFKKAINESKISHSVNVLISPDLLVNKPFRDWCAKLDIRAPVTYDKRGDLWVARLTQLPGPDAMSKFAWASLLKSARDTLGFPAGAILDVESLNASEDVSSGLMYHPEALDGMFIVVRDVQYLSLVKKAFLDWLDGVTDQLKAESKSESKEFLGATTAFIENPITVRLVEEIDRGASQSRQLVTLFIVSLDVLVIISFLITGIVRVQVTKSVLGLLRMMGASRYDLIAVTLCQNLMLGLMGLGIGYIIGYSTLILYFSVHGVPLAVFANPYFVLTSMLSFVLGLLFMAAAASGSAIMVSFESPARLINTH